MTFLTIPQNLTKSVMSSEIPGWVVILSSQLLLFFFGFFLDILSIIIITIPIIVPIILAYGYDPIWFGIMIVVNMEMAVLTPPVALNLWVFYGVARKYGYRLKEDIILELSLFWLWMGFSSRYCLHSRKLSFGYLRSLNFDNAYQGLKEEIWI